MFVPVGLVMQLLGLPTPVVALGGTDVWAWSALTSTVWCGYYVAFESFAGATLGKRLVKVRVAAAGGGHPSGRPGVWAVAQRNLWMLLGVAPLVGGVAQLIAVVAIAVTISKDDHHRGAHDRLAGTTVLA